MVARRIARDVPAGVDVIECDGVATAMMDAFAGADAVVVVDAAHSGAEPGRIHRFEAHAGPLPARTLGYSTHGFGVPQAIELARALGTLPGVTVVIGVEARAFDHAAEGLSPEAEAAVETTATRVLEEISSWRG